MLRCEHQVIRAAIRPATAKGVELLQADPELKPLGEEAPQHVVVPADRLHAIERRLRKRAPSAIVGRALQDPHSVAATVVYRGVEQLELGRAVGLADHIPEVFQVDCLGFVQDQVLDVQVRIALGGNAVLGALEFAAALLAPGPVAVPLGVVGELALTADQADECLVEWPR